MRGNNQGQKYGHKNVKGRTPRSDKEKNEKSAWLKDQKSLGVRTNVRQKERGQAGKKKRGPSPSEGKSRHHLGARNKEKGLVQQGELLRGKKAFC